jgi:predicted dehydrogenase
VALASFDEPFALLQHFGYTAQLRALVDDISRGDEPLMSAGFGREVLQVVLAAYQSAGRDTERVALPFTGPRDRTPLQLWHGA